MGGLTQCGKLAAQMEHTYRETGRWSGSPLELWATLFFQHRACRHSGWDLEGERLVWYDDLCATLRRALQAITPAEREMLMRYVRSECADAQEPRSMHYKLLNAQRKIYLTEAPGTLGGYRPNRIYGRLDCPSALRHLASGQYAKHRVFFADEATAIAAGFRPCGVCMKARHELWTADPGAWLAAVLSDHRA
ncbi:Ada metal-binding domain-containing protein [Microvirga terrae]